MIRSRYPFTSDPSIVSAQRGAAAAKSIAATAVLGGILAIAVLTSREVQPPSGISDGFTAPASSTLVQGITSNEGRPSGELDPQLHFDPREIADYRSNVHG